MSSFELSLHRACEAIIQTRTSALSTGLVLLLITVATALVFDFLNGFHDAANSIATVVSTRVLSPKLAVLWAAAFNFLAAFFLGTAVAKMIGKGMIQLDIVTQYVVLAGLLGAIVWDLLTWLLGLPTSSSHALIGGYAGAAMAQDLVAKKDFGRALLEFKNAAKAMPKDAEPNYQIGLSYLALQDFRYALVAFRKAVELDPKHAGAQLKLAEMEANSRNRDLLGAAQARLHLIVASSPDNLEAINALAIAEWRLGETDTASKLLEETLEKFPANLRSAISLERMKLRQKDVSGAEAVLQKAAASAPQSPLPMLALGQLYVVLNQIGREHV